jgi:thymidine kinase
MIEVICGPMFSGKSEELIRRLTRAKIAQKQVRAFKPQIDDRYGATRISSLSGSSFQCISVDRGDIIENLSGVDTDVVGIDEIQFFDEDVISAIHHLSDTWRKHVIVSGLDMTYRREPFGVVPHLLAIADNITKLSAVCHKCGKDAIYTQRLIDGEPAPLDAPTVQVGGLDTYEARCQNCYRSENFDGHR